MAGYVWLGLVGGLVTYTLWFDGIGHLPVTSAALLGLLSPIVAAALGAILLGQLLGPIQILGFLLALAAIAAGQFDPDGRAARQPTERTMSHPTTTTKERNPS